MPDDDREPFLTRAVVLVPSLLSYCFVHSEDHFSSLCNEYKSAADVDLVVADSDNDDNQQEVFLWLLEEHPATSEFTMYHPFHLDFGPCPWPQCLQALHAIEQFADDYTERRRLRRKTSRRHHRLDLDDDEDTPTISDDPNHNQRGPNPPPPPMILVVVRYYNGVTMATNLVTMLGMMAIARGSIASPNEIPLYFPEDTVMAMLVPFHDATPFDDVEAFFDLSARDCLVGALHAWSLWRDDIGDTRRFAVAHDYFQQIENGDVSWIAPWKLAAFACPSAHDDAPSRGDDGGAVGPKSVGYYSGIFSDPRGFFGCVDTVMQLNANVRYNTRRLSERGVRHRELSFPDGSVPSTTVIAQFFEMVDEVNERVALEGRERSDGRRPKTAVALHCMAGLGRTGTLICLALMRDYGFTAKGAIGWSRLCRPGCVIGPQQNFLCYTESQWKRALFAPLPMASTNTLPQPADRNQTRGDDSQSVTEEVVAIVANSHHHRKPAETTEGEPTRVVMSSVRSSASAVLLSRYSQSKPADVVPKQPHHVNEAVSRATDTTALLTVQPPTDFNRPTAMRGNDAVSRTSSIQKVSEQPRAVPFTTLAMSAGASSADDRREEEKQKFFTYRVGEAVGTPQKRLRKSSKCRSPAKQQGTYTPGGSAAATTLTSSFGTMDRVGAQGATSVKGPAPQAPSTSSPIPLNVKSWLDEDAQRVKPSVLQPVAAVDGRTLEDRLAAVAEALGTPSRTNSTETTTAPGVPFGHAVSHLGRADQSSAQGPPPVIRRVTVTL